MSLVQTMTSVLCGEYRSCTCIAVEDDGGVPGDITIRPRSPPDSYTHMLISCVLDVSVSFILVFPCVRCSIFLCSSMGGGVSLWPAAHKAAILAPRISGCAYSLPSESLYPTTIRVKVTLSVFKYSTVAFQNSMGSCLVLVYCLRSFRPDLLVYVWGVVLFGGVSVLVWPIIFLLPGRERIHDKGRERVGERLNGT